MESQCEYFMYFPAVPISDLSDPGRYRTLPRRSHLYLGETVRFLLVLRCSDAGSDTLSRNDSAFEFGTESASGRAWRELASSLCAVASVSPGESRHRSYAYLDHDHHSSGNEGPEEGEETEGRPSVRRDAIGCGFKECKPLLIHNNGSGVREFRKAPLKVIYGFKLLREFLQKILVNYSIITCFYLSGS